MRCVDLPNAQLVIADDADIGNDRAGGPAKVIGKAVAIAGQKDQRASPMRASRRLKRVDAFLIRRFGHGACHDACAAADKRAPAFPAGDADGYADKHDLLLHMAEGDEASGRHS